MQYNINESGPRILISNTNHSKEAFLCEVQILRDDEIKTEILKVSIYDGITPGQFTMIWIKILSIIFLVTLIISLIVGTNFKKISKSYEDL